jgi:ubiquinone/menaquinone biosynthesis C-methylase UbiE
MSRQVDGYVAVEYNSAVRPLTEYPKFLTKYLFNRFEMNGTTNLLEVGCGRGEGIIEFAKLGVICTCVDSDQSALDSIEQRCSELGLKVKTVWFDAEKALPFPDASFDVVYTKSFIEHTSNPVSFLKESKRLLTKKGKTINLIPDWESQFKTFYDDATHITPLTLVGAKQAVIFAGFKNVYSEKFRQLPKCWKYPLVNKLADVIAPFIRHRTKNKTLRWIRELMILVYGEND